MLKIIYLYLLNTLIFLFKFMPKSFEYYLSGYFKFNLFNFNLVLMSLLVLIFLTMIKNYHFFCLKFKLTFMLFTVMIFFFLIDNLFYFYLAFEMSVMPIFLMVFSFGYQPERLTAFYFIFIYTFIASIPFLFIILENLNNSLYSFFILEKNFLNFNFNKNWWNFLLLGFLVKFPMMTLHEWLPYAHVEASLEGSVILAAVMLKMGGWGVWCYVKLVDLNSYMFYILMSINLVSLFFMPFLILGLMDLKIIIAYSSIGHMAFTIILICLQSSMSYNVSFLIFVLHGFISSSLFYSAFLMSEESNSRNLFFNKNVKCFNYFFGYLLTMICIWNMGGPFTLTLFCEVISCIYFLLMSKYFLVIVFFTMMFNMGFNVNLISLILSKHYKMNMKKYKMIKNNYLMMLEFFFFFLILYFVLMWNIFVF